ncbi:MAG: xanthine dehydrogenase family protein molybdopterin-binding subunit [Nitrospinae bacterium]|nr:xanthine dehydrogenase family protein molybdopterin-binding subunit [Nitrospinota bacterium]
MGKYSVIGKNIKRLDAVEKVTGKAVFADDKGEKEMLYGKILYSPHAHARILKIDTSAAEALPGVRAVATAQDCPGEPYGWLVADERIFATGKVYFKGDRVAAAAADTEEIAEKALEMIKVEYEVLPALLDPEEALRPDAPILHEKLSQYGGMLPPVTRKGNANMAFVLDRGDVHKAFQESDLVVEGVYTTPNTHQGYLEPHSAIARVEEDGQVTIWTTTQATFILRMLLSQALGLPEEKIEIVPSTIGAGFGGKFPPLISHVATVLARKTRRPVKITISREEEFTSATPRSSAKIYLKTGVKKDGTILAREAKVIYDSGGYAGMTPLTAQGSSSSACGPYHIENAHLEGYSVYINGPNCGSYRAPGFPQVTFAVESQMDEIAQKLGIDPLDLRRKNALRDGDATFAGEKLKKSSLPKLLDAVAEGIGWGTPSGKNRGKGIACGQWNTMAMPSGAEVTLNEDGTLSVVSGVVDLTGAPTVLAQVAAEEFGIPFEWVSIRTEVPNKVPMVPPSGGSMIAYNMSNAIKVSCDAIKKPLFELASGELGVSPQELSLEGGQVVVAGNPQRGIALRELASRYRQQTGKLLQARTENLMIKNTITLVAQAAEVEVDPETGEVTLLKFVAAQDVGLAFNPLMVEGQIQGGAVQGIGFGLMEQMKFSDGRMINPNFTDYKMPTAMDLPNIDPILIEEPSGTNPYGARGVGEPPHVPSAAAIANAIANATGVRVNSLPVTPEKILAALKNKS